MSTPHPTQPEEAALHPAGPSPKTDGRKAARCPASRASLLWIALPALVVRLVHLGCISDLPFFDHPMGDARAYTAWAQRIAAGEWIGTETFYQAPLYPYFLGAIFLASGSPQGSGSGAPAGVMDDLIGAPLAVVRLVQAGLGSLSCVLLAAAAGTMFGRRTAWTAGWMLAFYPPAIFFDGLIQKTSLACFLLCGLLAVWAAWLRRLTPGRGAATGFVLGLLILTRENAWVWAPLLAASPWIWRRSEEKVERLATASLAAILGLATVLFPVGLRNRLIGGAWSFSTFQMGPNFYIGNSRDANGRYRPLVRGHETPEFERADATRLAEQALGRSLSASEVSRFWFDLAVRDMRASPGRALSLLGRKVLMAVHAYEVGDVEAYSVYARRSLVLEALGRVWHFGVLLPLAAAGCVLTRRRKPAGSWLGTLFLTLLGAVALFFILGRYRFPLAILLMPWAAAGVVCGVRLARLGAISRLSGAFAAALVGAVIGNLSGVHPRAELDALAISNLGVAYAERGKLNEAVACFEQAVHDAPTSAEAQFNYAQALVQTGRVQEALAHFSEARRWAPGLREVDLAWGEALEALGRRGEAHARYAEALRHQPHDPRILEALARTAPDAPED